MEKILHPAVTRGSADYGWLRANYSFSFSNYFNPNRLQFGRLRVLNDDVIAPAMGFGTHPHQNMEIITIPQKGAVKHKDSMGNEGVVTTGDIQVMSAGSGVEHSERNASTTEELKLFQIWLLPDTQNVTPRYDQKEIAPMLRANALTTVIKPKSEANDDELWIHQNAYFNIGDFDRDTTTTYALQQPSNGMYLMVIHGSVIVDNETLSDRDAIGIWNTPEVSLSVTSGSRVLLIEVPMN